MSYIVHDSEKQPLVAVGCTVHMQAGVQEGAAMVSAHLCGSCDSTHLEVILPGAMTLSLLMLPREAELLASWLISPGTKKKAALPIL